MNERSLKILVEAGAVKAIRIIADRSHFYVEIETLTGKVIASSLNGSIKNWGSLDSTAKWVRKLGIGQATLNLANWQPNQRSLSI
jgi:hypothetical protein